MAKFRIKDLAKERGWTAEELARRANLKVSTVQNLWQGRIDDPRYSTLKALALALNVPVESLETVTEEARSSDPEDRPERQMPSLVYLGA